MNRLATLAVLFLIPLAGCADYEMARQHALTTAQDECAKEGKQLQIVDMHQDTAHQDVVLKGHCLGPGDSGYVPPAPAK